MTSKSKITVIMMTYNHQNYIKKAIESILSQSIIEICDIVIHDDASTDSTPEIINNYYEMYPELIKPIFSKSNCFSKGASGIEQVWKRILDRVDSEFIAICEGDDEWIHPFKLQMQLDIISKDPSISMVTNRSITMYSGQKKGYQGPTKEGRYSTSEVILGDGGMFPTASIFMRSEIIKSMPKFFYESKIGDYPMVIISSLRGDIYHINEALSIYNIGVEGGFSDLISKGGLEIKLNIIDYVIELLSNINIYTEKQFDFEISFVQLNYRIKYLTKIIAYDKSLKVRYVNIKHSIVMVLFASSFTRFILRHLIRYLRPNF